DPPAVSPRALRCDCELRIERRGAGGGVSLHGRAEDGGARDVARRRAYDDAVSGDELTPRAFSQASRADGDSGESGAVVGGNRGVGGHYWRSGAGAVRLLLLQ